MDKNKLEIERLILKMIIGMVHSDSIRISDTCQRELVFLVRARIPRNQNVNDLDIKEIKRLVKKLSDEIALIHPGSISTQKRAVVRKSFLRRVTSFLSDIWPFGE